MGRTAWQRRAPDHFLVQGDTGRQITEQLLDGNGVPVDLSSGSPSVRYILHAPGAASPKVAANAAIITAAEGIVRYSFLAADIDTDGDFLEEWQVTTGSNVITYPEPGPHKVRIRAQTGS